MVKIRTPAGEERQGHLCCSRAGPCRADRRHGEGGTVIQARSLRNASRESPAIPEAAAHLSGMRCSQLLTTASNWTIFSYLSGSQLHCFQHASARTETAQDKESLVLVFLTWFPFFLAFFLCSLTFFCFFPRVCVMYSISIGCSPGGSEVTEVYGIVPWEMFEVSAQEGFLPGAVIWFGFDRIRPWMCC